MSRLEIERDGPTYTVDTLRELRAQRGDVELFFVTGADAMLEILQWKDPEEALELAHFIAATRPGYDLADFQQGASASHPRVMVMTIPGSAVTGSSSELFGRDTDVGITTCWRERRERAEVGCA